MHSKRIIHVRLDINAISLLSEPSRTPKRDMKAWGAERKYRVVGIVAHVHAGHLHEAARAGGARVEVAAGGEDGEPAAGERSVSTCGKSHPPALLVSSKSFKIQNAARQRDARRNASEVSAASVFAVAHVVGKGKGRAEVSSLLMCPGIYIAICRSIQANQILDRTQCNLRSECGSSHLAGERD